MASNSSSDTSPSPSPMYKACEFEHPYPCTKILWSPDKNTNARDLLATSGDYLRIWNLEDDGSGLGTLDHKKEALFNNVRYMMTTLLFVMDVCLRKYSCRDMYICIYIYMPT